jgi:hypothetical protein
MKNNIENNIESDKKSLDFFLNEPEINNYVNKFNLRNLLELSTVSDLYLFKKKKNLWILKDKRILLKECEYKKKKTVKEVSSSINTLNNTKNIKYNDIKEKTNNLLNKVGNIDSLMESIEKNYPIISDEYQEVYSNKTKYFHL